jgi:hypothetical protein
MLTTKRMFPMVSTQNQRLRQIGLLLGACALAFVYLVPGGEKVDANIRIKDLVEATSLAGGCEAARIVAG